MRFRNIKKNNTKPEKKPEKKAKLAKTTDRIKAFITDMFMIYAPILYIITYGFMDGKDDFLDSDIAPLLAVSVYGVIYSIFHSQLGQTPGKKAYEIKVVNIRTGENLSFFRAFYRYVLFLISAASIIGLIFPLYTKKKKALHDLICGSVVIVDPKEPKS